MSFNQSVSFTKAQFWKIFGQYMAPVPSAVGAKINWINYKTSVRFIRFIMHQCNGEIVIALELSNPDLISQGNDFEQLNELKIQFIKICGEDWVWNKCFQDAHGKTVSSISSALGNVTVSQEKDWSEIISFLKPRLIALDEFWNLYKYVFQL